jgi:invasion protein IalB
LSFPFSDPPLLLLLLLLLLAAAGFVAAAAAAAAAAVVAAAAVATKLVTPSDASSSASRWMILCSLIKEDIFTPNTKLTQGGNSRQIRTYLTKMLCSQDGN